MGGAFHAARGTLFLVQDRQIGAGNAVCSDRPDMVEFTPTGTIVRMHAVPVDVGGMVSKLAGTPCPPRAP